MSIIRRLPIIVIVLVIVAISTLACVVGMHSYGVCAEASDTPIISIDKEFGWQSSVTVTITWDASQQESGRYYDIAGYDIAGNPIKTSKKLYKAPFELRREGEVYVRAFYTDAEGNETYVQKKVSNIDSTPPSESAMSSAVLTVDLRSKAVLYLTVRLYDARSGIQKGYIEEYGDELTLLPESNGTYGVDVTPYMGRSVTIVAVDKANNATKFTRSLAGYNEAIIRTYSKKYANIDFDEYGEGGKIAIDRAFDRLSNELTTPSSDSSVVNGLAREADLSIEGRVIIDRVIETKPDYGTFLDFVINANSHNVDVKKGEEVTLVVNGADIGAKEEVRNSVGEQSGYKYFATYAFNLGLKSGERKVALKDELAVTVSIPDGRFPVQVYRVFADGTTKKLSSRIDEDSMTVTFFTDELGDYVIVGVAPQPQKEPGKGITVKGKFYSLELILSAVGIAVGVSIGVGAITFVVLAVIKKKRNGRF